MRTKAWFHLNTMLHAYRQMEAYADEMRVQHEADWNEAKEVGWVWESWFSLPKKRELTWSEYCNKQFPWKYEWKRKRKREEFLRDAERHISMAYRSEGNIVLLSEYDARNDFAGLLTSVPADTENQLFLIEG